MDPTSAFAPKMKLRVNGDLVDWLTQLDLKATESLKDHVSEHPYSPCLKQTAYGSQIEVKPLEGTKVWVYDEGRHKRRGTLADLKKGATVSIKASGFGIVLHKNNGGGSKISINARKVWVLPQEQDEEDSDEECAFVPQRRRLQ